MFDNLIEKLLELQNSLEVEKQARIDKAILEIEQEFESNANKIQKALDDFGYIKPQEVVEEPQENYYIKEEN